MLLYDHNKPERETERERGVEFGRTSVSVVMLQGDHDHPICPVLLKDAKLAADFADLMLSMFNTIDTVSESQYVYRRVAVMYLTQQTQSIVNAGNITA